MKNRTFVIITRILIYAGFIGLMLSFFVDYPTWLWYAFGILMSIGMSANLFVCHCPNCRELGLRPNPFAKNAGKCKRCGVTIEYKRRDYRKEAYK